MRKVRVTKKTFRENEYLGEAFFHQWGVDFEEFEAGPANYTTAIVEFSDGRVDSVPVNWIQFLDRPE